MPDFNGIEVSEEVHAAILASEAGLKAKTEELLSEKKTAVELANSRESDIKAKQDALTLAEEEKLKLSGDIEGLKSHYEKQNAEREAELKSTADKYQGALLSRDTDKIKGDVLSKVQPDFKEFADAMLDRSMTVSYNEKGELVTEFKTDDGVVSSTADFISWASEKSDTWKKVLLAANVSGGNATQSKAGSLSKSYSDMTLSERAIYNSK